MPNNSVARPRTAIEFAIGVLAARSLPEKKLRERLAPRYDGSQVEGAIERLRELRMVDDAAWAERYVRDRFERLGKGRHRIRNELLARGIAASIADASIASVLGGDVEREKAAAVLATMRARLSRGTSPVDGTADSEASADPASSGSPEVDADARRTVAAPARFAERTAARRASENLKNRLFRRMLARGYPGALVRDLLDVS